MLWLQLQTIRIENFLGSDLFEMKLILKRGKHRQWIMTKSLEKPRKMATKA